MAGKVDERIPENVFVNMMIEKANIIKDHLNKSMHPLIIVANIGPTMAIFKFYDTTEEDDSLKLCMTLSNLGGTDEQICVLWQQVNFLLQQYLNVGIVIPVKIISPYPLTANKAIISIKCFKQCYTSFNFST